MYPKGSKAYSDCVSYKGTAGKRGRRGMEERGKMPKGPRY